MQANVLLSKFIIMIEPNSDESSGHAKPIIGVAYVTRVMTPQKAMTYHAMSTANRAVARSTSEPRRLMDLSGRGNSLMAE